MTTTSLPPNHEPYAPDLARKYGAVKGMMYRFKNSKHADDLEWSIAPKFDRRLLDELINKCDFCGPVGTCAALTTPLPEGKCDCATSVIGRCLSSCSSRRRWLRILPHELAALDAKPEGLVCAYQGTRDWKDNVQWPFVLSDNEHFAYAVPAPLEEKGKGDCKHHIPLDSEEGCAECEIDARRPASHPAQADPPPIATGKDFFNEWCGESYKWAYLPAVEREHWNRFAKAILKRYVK